VSGAGPLSRRDAQGALNVGTGDRRVPLILDVDTGIDDSLAGERAELP
jgi:hypothetical protein